MFSMHSHFDTVLSLVHLSANDHVSTTSPEHSAALLVPVQSEKSSQRLKLKCDMKQKWG